MTVVNPEPTTFPPLAFDFSREAPRRGRPPEFPPLRGSFLLAVYSPSFPFPPAFSSAFGLLALRGAALL